MTPNEIAIFRSGIIAKLEEFSGKYPNDSQHPDVLLRQATLFYKKYEDQLNNIIEDTQTTIPITNTIFLMHQIEQEVNNYFGLREAVR